MTSSAIHRVEEVPEPGWYIVRVALDGASRDDGTVVIVRFFADESTPVHIVQRYVPISRAGATRIVHVPVHTARVDVELEGAPTGATVVDATFQPLPGPIGPATTLGAHVVMSALAGRRGLGRLVDTRSAFSRGGVGAVRSQLAVQHERLQHEKAIGLDDYGAWRERNVEMSDEDRTALIERLEAAEPEAGWPLISIVMGVHDPDPDLLEATIESLRNQVFDRWELVITDDASKDLAMRARLERAGADERIRVERSEENLGISEATNQAIARARGEWLAFMDHDDLLEPFALAEIALAARDADVIYTDEDKVERSEGVDDHSLPHFKPRWNPELLLGQNYCSHLSAIRSSLVNQVGGLRSDYDGAQDWDLLLRATDATLPERIRHIPLVAYSWRVTPGSTALSINEKPGIGDVGRRVLVDHLGSGWSVTEVAPTAYEVKPPLPDPLPAVSIVIPTRDRVDLLTQVVEGLDRTDYPNLEVVVVDNNSTDPETLTWLDRFDDGADRRVLRHPGEFNFSKITNAGVAASRGDIVVLLNNDIEVTDPGWLKAKVAWLVREGIGVVGAKLLFDNDTIQHAGVILGLGGIAGHGHLHEPARHHGYHNRLRLTHEVGAVTGACLATHRHVWDAVGGLDEELGVAFNDIDYCVRVREELGLRTLWTPSAQLIHHESLSRGPEDSPEKVARYVKEATLFYERWAHRFADDPAHSPNLALDGDAFIRTPHPRLDGSSQS